MKLTPEEKQEIKERYLRGESSPSIAPSFRVSPVTIRRILKEKGVFLRNARTSKRTKSLKHTAFDSLNPQACYWIGFLMADGSISVVSDQSAYVTLTLHKKDKGHVEKFRTFLWSDHAITEVKGHSTCRYSVSSIELVDALAKHGVVPNKTKTAKADRLKFDKHFWRGIIDGDGSVSLKNGIPSISLTGSKNLVTDFEYYIKALGIETVAAVRPHKSGFSFRVSGSYAQIAIKYLYSNPYISLDRNQEIANKIIAMR